MISVGLYASASQPRSPDGLGAHLGSTNTRVQRYRYDDDVRTRNTTITRVTETRYKRGRVSTASCGKCDCCESWHRVNQYIHNNINDPRLFVLIPRLRDEYLDDEEGEDEHVDA